MSDQPFHCGRCPLSASRTAGVTALNNEDFLANNTKLGWTATVERDPFLPAAEQVKNSDGTLVQGNRQVADLVPPQPVPVLRLSAVALEPEPKVAMINRKLVAEGDRVEGMRVARIEANGVWLHGPSGPHHVGFEDPTKTTTRQQRRQDSERKIIRSQRVSEMRRVEEPRKRKDAVLKDGRDCSISAACS